MSKKKLSISDLKDKLGDLIAIVRPYVFVAFLVLVAGLYGFLFFRISSLSSSQPSQNAVSAEVSSSQMPHIDKTVVQQLNSLQDNSVSVQTLFSQSRSNPFQ